MFSDAVLFNQSLNWDTSNVTGMSGMFAGSGSFDQSLSSWDTSNVTDMSWMFDGATSFDQSLGEWNIRVVGTMEGMLIDSAMSVGNYDATLIGWEDGPKMTNVVLGANGLRFGSLGSIARESLNCLSGWTFTGDIFSSDIISTGSDQIVTTAC
jgi:surface protein